MITLRPHAHDFIIPPSKFVRHLCSRAVLKVLLVLTGARALNRKLREIAPAAFSIDAVKKKLGFRCDYLWTISPEEVDPDRNLIIVFNHPTGFTDIFCVLEVANALHRRPCVIRNRFARLPRPLHMVSHPVDPLGRDKTLNARAVSKIARGFGLRYKTLIVAPAGRVSRLRLMSFKIEDTDWSKSFIDIARRKDALILPVFVAARNSVLFYMISSLSFTLGTLLLPSEPLRRRNTRLQVVIGPQIEPKRFEGLKSADACKRVRQDLYRLGSHLAGTPPASRII